MKKIIIFGGAGVALVAGLGLAAAYFVLGVTKTADISDGVYQLYNENALGRIGANVTIFESGSSLVIVDAHLAPLAGGAAKKIAKRSNAPVRAVFNTHWHPDHTGGNTKFAAADIIAHENVKALLGRDHQGYGLTKPGSVHEFDALSADALPEILVGDEGATFTQYGGAFRAVHYPNAHTDGDLVIIAPDRKIVVLGDLVWPAAFPFIDAHNGGTAQGVLDALKDIAGSTDEGYRFLIGHGAPISHGDVLDYAAMIAASIDYVAMEKAAGKTLVQIQSAAAPASWARWESKLVPAGEWIKMIYETL